MKVEVKATYNDIETLLNAEITEEQIPSLVQEFHRQLDNCVKAFKDSKPLPQPNVKWES